MNRNGDDRNRYLGRLTWRAARARYVGWPERPTGRLSAGWSSVRRFITLLAIAQCLVGVAFAESSAPPGPVVATVCDLIGTPDAFRNRRVEVTGTIIREPDVLALRDDHCVIGGKVAPMIWLTTDAQRFARYSPDWTSDAYSRARRAGQITRASTNVTWVDPLAVSPMPQSDVDALIAAAPHSNAQPVRAVIVGRFDSSTAGMIGESKDGRTRWSPGFGHLSGYSCQIVIESVRLVAGD